MRAGFFTVVTVWLAVMAHAGAGGDLPDPATLVSGGAVIGFAAAGCAGRSRRFPEIAAALLGAQIGLHLLFAIGAHHPGAVLPTGPMLLAHLAAAVLSAGILAGAEAALDRLRHEVRRFLFCLAPADSIDDRSRSVLTISEPNDTRLGIRWLRRCPRRGPPQVG